MSFHTCWPQNFTAALSFRNMYEKIQKQSSEDCSNYGFSKQDNSSQLWSDETKGNASPYFPGENLFL